MIEIEIDGKTLPAEPGETIIQVADKAGIYIPRFCYHKKLSVVANCRMCLVDVEKAPKTLPACATPVAPGMKVNTRSEKALFSQKTVMEFLLINHPLDCPICDQGGECELQDLSLGYGNGVSRFTEGKRAVHDEDLGPLIATEMTRCIQCTRCVRFGDEVAGLRELGAMGRGEDLEIATYVGQAVASELSGNMIDVCPVGALTSKPYRFSARAWELRQHAAIAPHDCLGSNIYIHTRGEEYSPIRHVMRVVPRENEAINESWISDRDRFSYEAVNHPQRLLHPLLKRDGQWQEVTWDMALTETAQRLRDIVHKFSAAQIGALVSPSATLEEYYLLQKLLRGIGSHNIDHRLRHSDFRHQAHAPLYPSLGLPVADLEKLHTLLLIGSNVRSEQPIASQRIRKAVKQGAQVLCINPVDYDLNFTVAQKQIVGVGEFVGALAQILKALTVRLPEKIIAADWTTLLAAITPSEVATDMADKLLAGEKTAVLLGAYAVQHPDAALIDSLARQIAWLSQGSFGIFSEGANSAGAWLAGAVPHRSPGVSVAKPGLNAHEMLRKPLRAYVLLGVEPELDSAHPAEALQALQQAELVIALSAYRGGAAEDYAHIILPMAAFAETAGTYVNVEGTWQSMQPATLPQGEARPAWKILCQLARLLTLSGFDYAATAEVCDELNKIVPLFEKEGSGEISHDVPPNNDYFPILTQTNVLYRATEWPIYRVDTLVRHAPALQATIKQPIAAIHVNSALARLLNLPAGAPVTAIQNQSQITLPLCIDERIADNQVWIAAGMEETAGFGEAFGVIKLHI